MEIITHNKHAVNMTQKERFMSAVAGGVLAAAGLRRGGFAGLLVSVFGADLIRRALTGHSYFYEAMGIRTVPVGQGASASVPYELGVRVDSSITINRPRADVFRFWSDLRNLARVMQHVESVRQEGKRSHWVVKAPAGRTVEWDAIIHNEIDNELIAWRSLEGADVQNAGTVLFKDAPGGEGTVVKVELQYNPPGGAVGALLAQLWKQEPGMQIEEDLRRLKERIESGDRGALAAQPVGAGNYDDVDEASEESFPASDAPGYNH